MHSLDGRTLGQYRLIEQVGAGGMAIIYKAYDPSLDRHVAVKILPGYLAQGEDFSARFRNEARNIARLHHPNILPIYGYGEEDGISYFVMGLVEGGTLKDLMGEPMDAVQAVRLVTQLADALQYAHEQGIVHRDVKPANVLMSRSDWPLLSDFGIARVLEQQTHLTHSAFLGTPHYMAPEQARGEPVSPQTDQYALGIVLYEMLTGAPPFHADTPQAVVYQHIYADLPRPRDRNPAVPEPLERVILRALAKNPADRYPDMAGFAQALQTASGGTSTVAQPGEETGPGSETTGFPAQNASPAYTPISRAASGGPGPSTEQIKEPIVTTAAPDTSGGATDRSAAGRGPFLLTSRPVLLALSGAVVLVLALATAAVLHGMGSTTPPVAILKVTADRGHVPTLALVDAQGNNATDANGNDLSSVDPSQARRGIHLRQGSYQLQFDSGSAYNGVLPITLDSSSKTLNLSRRMAFIRIVPAPEVPLQGAEVDDASGRYLFGLSADAAGKTEALPAGSYRLTFNSHEGYIDDLPLRVSAGSHTTLNLAHIFARVQLDPPPGGPVVDIEVRNGKSGSYLHSVVALQARLGFYLFPGRYLFDLSGANAYPDPLSVTVHPGRQTVHLGQLLAGLTITPIAKTGLASFELKSAANPGTTDTVQAKDALAGVFLRPGTYQVSPSADQFLAPFAVTLRANTRRVVKLSNVYGAVSVVPAPGAGLTSIQMNDARGQDVHYFSGSDVSQHMYLPPGRYTLTFNTDSSSPNSYVDPLSITVTAGKSERLDLRARFAGLRVPVGPSSGSLSYSTHDQIDNTVKTVDAGSRAQVAYILPGTYRVEVTRSDTSRILTVRAPAGALVQLPSH